MDINKYNELKKKGVVVVSETEKGNYNITFKRFNPETGEQLVARVEKVTLESLEIKRKELQRQFDELDVFIKELQTPKEAEVIGEGGFSGEVSDELPQ